MIQSILLQNFKGFENFKAEGFSRFNLIGGKNNSGKSSLLEALFFMLGFPQHGLARISVSRYFDPEDSIDPEEIWGSSFYNKDHAKKIKFELEDDQFKKNTIINTWHDIFEPPIDNPNFQNVLAQQNNQKQLALNTSSKMLLIEYSSQLKGEKVAEGIWQEMVYKGTYINPLFQKHSSPPVIPQQQYFLIRSGIPYSYPQIKILFEKLLEKRKEADLVKFLQKIDPRIKSIMAYKKTLMLDLQDLSYRIPLQYMGDGTQWAILFYLAIANCPNGVVLIDEIENGLHHSVMTSLFAEIQHIAQEFNCQIFATTHSEECLQAAIQGFEKHPNDLRHIRINRISESEVISRTYSLEDLKIALENDWEVR